MLFMLVAAHALCDYPLQGDFLAQAKNRNTPLGKLYWPHALAAHAMIHGGAVLLITHSLVCACLEVLLHAYTDWLKCEGRISLHIDQLIHIACKFLWIGIVFVWYL